MRFAASSGSRNNFVISTLSNGNVSLLTNMAKNAGLPWDCVLSAELFRHYKPDPESYLGAANMLGLKPREVMLVAAHKDDLRAAKRLRAAHRVRAPAAASTARGSSTTSPPIARSTTTATDFLDLADQLGA